MLLVRSGVALALILVFALLLAACGGDDDSSGAPTTPTPTASEQEDEHEVHWGYDGETGAGNWAELSDGFAICEAGAEQSPIDIESAAAAMEDIAGPVLDWQTGDIEIINNGHTIQANVPEGSTSEFDDKAYHLLQFHWHRPSEHTVDGDPFAMELHFVHADASGNLAVLGVLIEEGDGNPLYDALWEQQPADGESRILEGVDFSQLLPDDLSTYVYAGSLTTPPCSEGVAWNVLRDLASVSTEQVEAFLYDGNARPVQPVNDRVVLADES